jgi:porin
LGGVTARRLGPPLLSFVLCATGQPATAERGRALSFEAAYSADLLANLSGGREQGAAYLDNLDVVLEGDLERLLGWPGSSFVVSGLYNNGNDFSGRYVGDAQVVSNIDTEVEAVRLFEAYVETRLGGGGSVLFGLYDLNSGFDALDSSALFMHSAHGIGTDIAQTGEAGPSIFPVTSLALRLAWEWSGGWSGRLAVLDAVPGRPDEPARTAVDLRGGEGWLFVGELERSWRNARVLAGAWRYTAAFPDQAASAAAGEPIEARGNHGFYVRGEWQPDAFGRPVLFGRVGRAAQRFNVFEWFASAGAVWEDAPGGALGVALAWAESSPAYRRGSAASGFAPERREVAFELSYAVVASERLRLQPNLQHVVNPGLDASLDDAWIAGMRMALTLW